MRMPSRPVYPTQGRTLMQRIGSMFTDVHTWNTLCYMWLPLPLGIAYFTVAVILLSVSLSFVAAPILKLMSNLFHWQSGTCIGAPGWVCAGVEWLGSWSGAVSLCVIGIVLLSATLHLARGLGWLHGHIAKHMLVPREVAYSGLTDHHFR